MNTPTLKILTPTVADLVEEGLRAKGYDGLYCEGCGCRVDDLFPCMEWNDDCRAGYSAPCPDTCGDHDWHIVPVKPETVKP